MKTIGAKELRLQLDQIIDQVLDGEEIIVKHRFKEPIRLQAVNGKNTGKDRLAGLQYFDKADKKPSPFDKNVDLKALYHDSLAGKYGQ